MPKHYCDYCDVYLTHDSTSVRKAHNSGRNHLSNVRDYYASLGNNQAQLIIDEITNAYESGGGPPPGGFGFGPQHLTNNQPGFPPAGGPGFGAPPFMPPRMPMMPPGGMPMMPPGAMPPFPPPPGMAVPPFPPNAAMPPFPPSGAPGVLPPFAPNAPSTHFPQGSAPPLQAAGPPAVPGSGPSIHPDRLKMLDH